MTVAYQQISECLAIVEPTEKCAAVAQLWATASGLEAIDDDGYPVHPIGEPGRPDRPYLVEPAKVPRRRLGSEEGRAALVHAVCHIEFNAINLALDAAYRFRDMPPGYALDWLFVAADEARHFQMLEGRLKELGYAYGDFPAHDGLWDMARKTAHECLERMALVPRVLEARGLDVTPGMIQRLKSVGDSKTVGILEIILEEEVRHVEIGSQWFRYCCDQAGLEPLATFQKLLRQHFSGRLRGPFNVQDRLRAGFSEAELEALEQL